MKRSDSTRHLPRRLWALVLLVPFAAHCADSMPSTPSTQPSRDPRIEHGRYTTW
jgi:hypothetical protein